MTHISKKNKGQYFTTSVLLKETIYILILNNPSVILEPSVGQGHLVEYIKAKKPNINFDLYEIDEKISFLDSIKEKVIKFGDFLECDIETTYDTIIGNPPFVKTKTGNLYIHFIEKCYKLLNKNGELIFIVPSDFLKLTSSSKIINEMMDNGSFTHIIHPHNENLFENASIDVIVFRYCKNSKLQKKTLHNGKEKHLINNNGIITFSDSSPENLSLFSEYFDIYVGMITGKEAVYKNEKHGNIELLNAKEKKDKYIWLKDFPTENTELNEYMLLNKDILIRRKIKKFTEKNWWNWGGLRNIKNIEKHKGKSGIYISTLTRKKEVAFVDKVQYFGGGLIVMIPKKPIDIKKLADYMNGDVFKSNYMYSGRFKIGHKQLRNCLFNSTDFI
jgi:adenine-specific DNA-methyltransferase